VTESLTLIPTRMRLTKLFTAVKAQFSEKEIVDLTYAISAI